MRAGIEHYVPQSGPGGVTRARAWMVWSACAFGACVWLGLSACAPWARAHGHEALATTLYQMFGVVCHQLPARSFYLAGAPLAVCARCFGLYAGFALGVLGYPLVRPVRQTHGPARRWLVLALLPTCVDFALGVTGLWANTHTSRALTGALFGAVAACYVVPGLVDLSRRMWPRRMNEYARRPSLSTSEGIAE
ncbi:MAG TPA: DUF2085 domain-containing protein [Pyrinomonadaceae bacterium]|jgi:uncharacterized membrane protein